MRSQRLMIGITSVAIAVVAIVWEQLAGASADAFVSARLTPLRAKMAGTPRELGLWCNGP